MVRTTSEGMGYRFSETNRRISTVGASNIITRLASRTVTGHDIPIHVHQHYALEFHFVLNPNTKNNGSVETCMRRGFSFPWDAQEVCLQLENSALSGLCSCIFNDRRVLSVADKVELCFRALPLKLDLCTCAPCTPYTDGELEHARWWTKYDQRKEKQSDICCCRQIDGHCETMMCKTMWNY